MAGPRNILSRGPVQAADFVTYDGLSLSELGALIYIVPSDYPTNSQAVTEGESLAVGEGRVVITFVDTDTGLNTAGGVFNNVTNPLTVTLAGHDLIADDQIRVESEIARVSVVDGDDVTLVRAIFSDYGIAAHTDGNDIFRCATSPKPGDVMVPVSGANDAWGYWKFAIGEAISDDPLSWGYFAAEIASGIVGVARRGTVS